MNTLPKADRIPKADFLLIVDLLIATHGLAHCYSKGSNFVRRRPQRNPIMDDMAYMYIYWTHDTSTNDSNVDVVDVHPSVVWETDKRRIIKEATYG